MNVNIRPVGDRVLVSPNPVKTETETGIILAPSAQEKPVQGTVVAVGKGRYSDHTGEIMPMEVKVGDKVLYGKYGGTEITHDGETYLMMRESDLYAVISSKKDYTPQELVEIYKQNGVATY